MQDLNVISRLIDIRQGGKCENCRDLSDFILQAVESDGILVKTAQGLVDPDQYCPHETRQFCFDRYRGRS